MKILAVLSHHMSNKGILEEESVARANLAVKIFINENHDLLFTNGWAYRSDFEQPISDVFANFITKNSNIKSERIISNSESRDTVGDAYFLRQRLFKLRYLNLTVITSDYHVKRTEIIFEKFFDGIAKVSVIGALTERKNDPVTLAHEIESTTAFEKSFKKVDFNNLNSLHETLSTLHPFYNGEVYPRIGFNHK